MTIPPRLTQLAYLFEPDHAHTSLYALDTEGQIWKKDLVPFTKPWEPIDSPPAITQILVIPEDESHDRTLYAIDAHGQIWAQAYQWLKPQGWTRLEGPHTSIPDLSVLRHATDPSITRSDEIDNSWPCRACPIIQTCPATTYWQQEGFCSVSCAMRDFVARSSSLSHLDDSTRQFLTTGIEELLQIAAVRTPERSPDA